MRQVSFRFFRTGSRLKEQSIEGFSDEELLSQVNPRRIYITIYGIQIWRWMAIKEWG